MATDCATGWASTVTPSILGQARDRPHGLLLPGHWKSGDLAPQGLRRQTTAPLELSRAGYERSSRTRPGATWTWGPRPPSRTSCATLSTTCHVLPAGPPLHRTRTDVDEENPWFDTDVLPDLKKRVAALILNVIRENRRVNTSVPAYVVCPWIHEAGAGLGGAH